MRGITHRADRPRPWLARYRVPAGGQRSRSFTTKKRAEKWLRSELSALDAGRWVDPRAGQVTLTEWAESWLAGVSVKPKTEAGYRSLLRSRIIPKFGDTQLRHISRRDVQSWIKGMEDDGLSASRIRQARQCLSAMLATAVLDGVIAKNPTEGTKLPKTPERTHRYLTVAQVKALAAHCEALRASTGRLVAFLAYSGLRWGEAVALRNRDVDPLRRAVSVQLSATEVGGSLVVGSPKSGRSRTITLPRFVIETVAPMMSDDRDATIWTAPGGGPLRSSPFRRAVWLPAVAMAIAEDADFPEDLRVHDLRHTAASLMVASGASVLAVQKALGHARASITLDTYAGLFSEDVEALADRMDERYGDSATGI